jgi:hypothetical protein
MKMKTIKLALCLLCAAAFAAAVLGCENIEILGNTTFKLVIENRTSTDLYVSSHIDSAVGKLWYAFDSVEENRTTLLVDAYKDHATIKNLALYGYIEFYYLVRDDSGPHPGEFIKSIADVNSIITLTADERESYGWGNSVFGEVLYKLVITNEMLGIDGGNTETNEDENVNEIEGGDTNEAN